jgi:glycosyltransferase involved in cell wall biosynthesis
MACGLPVITTPVGAIKTIVAHQETGLIVQAGNRQQLQDALVTILSDTTFASRLGQGGCQMVQQRYSAGSMISKYLTLFQSALQPA